MGVAALSGVPHAAGELAVQPGEAWALIKLRLGPVEDAGGDRITAEVVAAPGPLDEVHRFSGTEIGEPLGVDVPMVHSPSPRQPTRDLHVCTGLGSQRVSGHPDPP